MRSFQEKLIDYSASSMILFIFAFFDYTVLSVVIQCLFILLVIAESLTRKKILPLVYIIWWVIFVAWCAASFFWSKNIPTFVSVLISVIQVSLIGIAIVTYIDNEHRIYHIIKSMIFSAIVLCIRFFISVPISMWGNQERLMGVIPFFSNIAPMMLAFVSLIMFHFVITQKKIWFLPLITIMIFVAMLYGTRKALIIFILGAFVELVLNSKNSTKFIRNSIIGLLLLIGFYFLVTTNPLLYGAIGYRIEGMILAITDQGGDASSVTRIQFIGLAQEIFLKHPVFGVGLDGFRYLNYYRQTYTHNNYWELLCNLGAIGFMMYYSIYVYMGYHLVKNLRKNHFFVLTLTIMFCYLTIDYFNVSYFEELAQVLFAFSFAVMNINLRLRKVEQSRVLTSTQLNRLNPEKFTITSF